MHLCFVLFYGKWIICIKSRAKMTFFWENLDFSRIFKAIFMFYQAKCKFLKIHPNFLSFASKSKFYSVPKRDPFKRTNSKKFRSNYWDLKDKIIYDYACPEQIRKHTWMIWKSQARSRKTQRILYSHRCRYNPLYRPIWKNFKRNVICIM